MLKNVDYTKYFGDSLNRIDVVKNKNHKIVFLMQIIRDNQATLAFVKDVHIHERLKHIDVVYYHVQNLHRSNRIRANYVSNAKMIANGLTKSLSKDKFKVFIQQIDLRDLKDSGSYH